MIRVEGDGFVNILVRVACLQAVTLHSWADGPPVWIIMICTGQCTQTFQNPLLKECTLNHSGIPNMI